MIANRKITREAIMKQENCPREGHGLLLTAQSKVVAGLFPSPRGDTEFNYKTNLGILFSSGALCKQIQCIAGKFKIQAHSRQIGQIGQNSAGHIRTHLGPPFQGGFRFHCSAEFCWVFVWHLCHYFCHSLILPLEIAGTIPAHRLWPSQLHSWHGASS